MYITFDRGGVSTFAARPFLTPEEWTETERMVNEFEMGEGKELQDKLVERSRGTKNWVKCGYCTCTYTFTIRTASASILVHLIKQAWFLR